MKRQMFIAAFAVFFCFGALAADKPTPNNLESLQWMLGDWEKASKRGTIREDWKRVSSVTYEGVGYQLAKNGRKQVTESLRLVKMGSGIFYIAKPNRNAMPVAFKLVKSSKNEAVFENRKHDFPQKITYRRQGDALIAVVEGAKPGSGFTIKFGKPQE